MMAQRSVNKLSRRIGVLDRSTGNMVSFKLVRLIEEHTSELADGIVVKLHTAPQTRSLQSIPAPELRTRMQETLCQFHAWLLTSENHNVQELYRDLGRRHAVRDVALPDLCWAIVLIKEHLWNFVERQTFHTSPVEIHAEFELLRLLDLFFDRMICYVAEGYEQARNEMRKPIQSSDKPKMQLIPNRTKWLRSPRNSDATHGNG